MMKKRNLVAALFAVGLAFYGCKDDKITAEAINAFSAPPADEHAVTDNQISMEGRDEDGLLADIMRFGSELAAENSKKEEKEKKRQDKIGRGKEQKRQAESKQEDENGQCYGEDEEVLKEMFGWESSEQFGHCYGDTEEAFAEIMRLADEYERTH